MRSKLSHVIFDILHFSRVISFSSPFLSSSSSSSSSLYHPKFPCSFHHLKYIICWFIPMILFVIRYSIIENHPHHYQHHLDHKLIIIHNTLDCCLTFSILWQRLQLWLWLSFWLWLWLWLWLESFTFLILSILFYHSFNSLYSILYIQFFIFYIEHNIKMIITWWSHWL